jgi:cobalt-zinc-cadmium resistance protein CzcA
MAAELRHAVREFPEVSYIVTQLGRNDTGSDPWTPSHIESGVGLTPYSTWHGESKAQFLNKLNARLNQIPGISVGISQPIVDGENDMIGGAHSALVLRVYGDDFKELRRIGGEIVTVLRGVSGTDDVSIFQEPELPQLVIRTDRAAAARYGINVADVNTLIQDAVAGAPITQVFVADRTYNVTMHLPTATVEDREALGHVPLTSISGAKVPLDMVADIALRNGESTIAHEMGQRQITIRIDDRNRALSDYLADAQQKIDQRVHFDKEKYHLEWAGTFENERRAQARLTIVMMLVLAAMAALLLFEFGVLRQALLVLGVVPLAALGGLVALHVRGYTLNIATAVGFIALFGVAVQNGIIMVANFNRIRGEGLPLREAVLQAAGERFRPVLMTATVASIGMLPAALAIGVGTDVQRDLATVVVGGLAIATLLTLFILPTYYFAIERFVDGRRRQSQQEQV